MRKTSWMRTRNKLSPRKEQRISAKAINLAEEERFQLEIESLPDFYTARELNRN